MLTKGDLKYIFYTFSFLSRWWTFPAEFNRSSGSFHIQSGGRRRKRFRIVLNILSTHLILMSGRTFEAGAVSRNTPLEFLAFGILASMCACGIWIMGILVHQNLEIQVKLWTELLGRVNQSGRASPFGSKTWEELWISYMAVFIQQIPWTWPVAYSIKPDLPFMLYYNVPMVLKSTPTLILCCLIEMVITTFYSSMTIYFLVFVQLFGRQMKTELESLKEKVTRFGINPEISSKAPNVSEPIQFLEIEESANSESRVMPKAEDEMSRADKIEVVCEVRSKAGISRRSHDGNELKVKGKIPMKKVTTKQIQRKVQQDAEDGIQQANEELDRPGASKISAEVMTGKVDDAECGRGSQFRRLPETTTRSVKKRILKGAENWMVKKAEEWAAKKDKTWAGKTIGKWAIKRSEKWAFKRAQIWPAKPEETWAQKTERKWVQEAKATCATNRKEECVVINLEMEQIEKQNRVVDRDIERVINLEMEVMKAITETTDVEELKTACKTLEVFRLLFRLFNLGFADSIFLLKVGALSGSIWGMFAAIRLAGKHPEFAFFYLLMASCCFTCYIMMFNSAFHLSGLAEKCKTLILLQSTTLLNRKQQSKEEWNEIRCRIAAIPRLAMYSGHFHAVERNSTLIFINFVLNKLADLLLAF